ncbi:MAG: APC family permease [Wenzhouxiangellaceae bacterium]|nr:APC family permease [Wenzhouxiangellaceae bacterium]
MPGKPDLIRAVGRWQLVGISINDVIGSGIYLLPAAAAALLGPFSLWAILLAGLAVAVLVLCHAQAASYFDQPGGAYLYTREAFGDFIGFEVGWMTWLTRIASVAALSNGLTLALAEFWPAAASGLPRALAIGAALAVLAWANVVGVKSGARVAVALTIAKLIPLAFFVIVGVFYIDWSLLTMPDDRPVLSGSLTEAALLLLFAYAGFENTPAAAGEYRNPKRDVPFAMLTMITVITLVYVAVQAVALGTLPDLASAESPLARAAGQFAGPAAVLLLSVGAFVSIFGNLGNTTLIGPRYAFALADDGYGPRWLAAVHPRYHTPANAIVVQTAIALVLALSGSFVALAMLSVVARLATYIGTCSALLILQRRFQDAPDAFRFPGDRLLPVLGLALSLCFLAATSRNNLLAAAVALVAGVLIFRYRRDDTHRRSAGRESSMGPSH